MALTTEKLDLPYPELDDPADAPHDIRELAEKVDETVPAMLQGPFVGLPPAGTQGRFYFANDRGTLLFDDGANWQPVSAMIGDLKFSSRAAEHQGWIIANGRALSAGQYPQLRAILIADGSMFGNTSGNPKLPDMRGRAPIGAGQGSGLTSRVAGAIGGAETHDLQTTEIPPHAHSASASSSVAGGHSHGVGVPNVMKAGSGANVNFLDTGFGPAPNWQVAAVGGHAHSISVAVAAAGGGLPHNNMQPFAVAQWFIYGGPAA